MILNYSRKMQHRYRLVSLMLCHCCKFFGDLVMMNEIGHDGHLMVELGEHLCLDAFQKMDLGWHAIFRAKFVKDEYSLLENG